MNFKNEVLCYMPVIAARAAGQLLKIALLLTPPRNSPSHSQADNEGQGKSREFTSSIEERTS